MGRQGLSAAARNQVAEWQLGTGQVPPPVSNGPRKGGRSRPAQELQWELWDNASLLSGACSTQTHKSEGK
jgi:hypothetical protein